MAKLIPIQQPQGTFHKDEGGKTNNLAFRFILQGEIDLSCGGSKGEVPLDVIAVFEDGTIVPKQEDIITITGCTEKPSGGPCLCLVSRLGGVTYRLKQVSKRLDDRAVCVRVSLKGCPEVEAVTSEGTMVFSKRKNRTQREQQQHQEKLEMDRKEAEAARVLVTGGFTPSPVSFEGEQPPQRPNKIVKFDIPSGATTISHTSTTSVDSDDELSYPSSLQKRVSDLEKLVQEQQRAIEELRESLTLSGPPATRRLDSSSWMVMPNLRRDVSLERLDSSYFNNPATWGAPLLRRDISDSSMTAEGLTANTF